MTVCFYRGTGGERPQTPTVPLPGSRRTELEKPEDYVAEPGLAGAVNVALLLGQPLLLTGEPGTGKTQLAYSLAWELGLDAPLKFETKSDSRSRDLFYTYDAIGRFQARDSGESTRPLHYITYNALGLAILRSNPPDSHATLVPSDFEHDGPKRSVVLIDEVDKAPRDFPNDILNEIDGQYFRIPELRNAKVQADPDMQPVVVITSNSEKDLPDAFLRRCIYYNIPFPKLRREKGADEQAPDLLTIVERRLGSHAGGTSTFLDEALEVFALLRKSASGLRKRPATAELLNWLVTLHEMVPGVENPLAKTMRNVQFIDPVLHSLSALVKTAEDQARATQLLRQWLTGPRR